MMYLSGWLGGCWPMARCCAEGLCLAEFVPDGGALSVKSDSVTHRTIVVIL